jgi:hypothetical protein
MSDTFAESSDEQNHVQVRQKLRRTINKNYYANKKKEIEQLMRAKKIL